MPVLPMQAIVRLVILVTLFYLVNATLLVLQDITRIILQVVVLRPKLWHLITILVLLLLG